jgi:hypothetical protein
MSNIVHMAVRSHRLQGGAGSKMSHVRALAPEQILSRTNVSVQWKPWLPADCKYRVAAPVTCAKNAAASFLSDSVYAVSLVGQSLVRIRRSTY